jgi:hypothetical protein
MKPKAKDEAVEPINSTAKDQKKPTTAASVTINPFESNRPLQRRATLF